MLLVVTEHFLLDLGLRDHFGGFGSLSRCGLLHAELLNTVGVDLELFVAELVSSFVSG